MFFYVFCQCLVKLCSENLASVFFSGVLIIICLFVVNSYRDDHAKEVLFTEERVNNFTHEQWKQHFHLDCQTVNKLMSEIVPHLKQVKGV